ncbi:MBL fold metallo-hydrolase [Winogradskya consettensis]|nr:MBL fold metallo-hydrolase [Actinoplanes consettensis]
MITRRRLLFTAGSGVLGVALLGSCSEKPENAAPAPSSSSSSSGGTGGWQRVNLSFVSAYLLIRGNEAAVVDLGTAGSADAIGSALTAAGSGWGEVKHVILTHNHGDHAGGLAGVEPQVNAVFYAGVADVAGIKAAKSPVGLKDGDEVFGLQIIGTPGHTAGHISVFDPSTGTLVAGDALRTTDGLAGADPQYTADPGQAALSVRKLSALPVTTILPGHGDPLTTGAAEALKKLAATP